MATFLSDLLAPPAEGNSPSGLLPLHEQRDALFNELHTRPFPLLEMGQCITQLAVLHEGRGVDEEYAHIRRLADVALDSALAGSVRFGAGEGQAPYELRWERHTEFSTYTFILPASSQPFSGPALPPLPSGWLGALPGRVISGLQIELHPGSQAAPLTADTVRPWFDGHRLISSWVIGRKARIWTAYRLHADGLGRVLVLNEALNPCQLGRLVRRLLEIETYRMMLLLAFPLARSVAPEIADMGQELAAINARLTGIRGLDDERQLLGQLSALAARIEQLRATTTFRFSAARAYYDLVLSRLKGLRETEEPGLQTLEEFLLRRLTPAYSTTQSISSQLNELSSRIDRASELLRTRIELGLEEQNQDLLKSMNRRSKQQLQLQQAVEGLSVVAISYYLVGLVKYMASALHAAGWVDKTDLLVGLMVPVSLLLVWLGINRLHRHLPS